LDYTKDKALWIELADILKTYAELGVDGFRCDVASLVPVEFWLYARKVVSKVNRKDDLAFRIGARELSANTSVTAVFRLTASRKSMKPSTSPTTTTFIHFFEDYLHGKRPLREYLESLKRQDEIYPANYVKLKYRGQSRYRTFGETRSKRPRQV
jgi:cyclomaltodextrinase / maltogenic alpha-amylase / neopullulanase